MGFVEAIGFLSDAYFVFIVTLALIAFLVVIIKEAICCAFSKGEDSEEDEAVEDECNCALCPHRVYIKTEDVGAEEEKTENSEKKL